MVLVPGGTYTIGVSGARAQDGPAHGVTLDSFAIGLTEVTVADYRRYMAATNTPAPWGTAEPDSMLPVTRLNWSEAAAYCGWRHQGRGKLPSEEQWEAAARGAEGRRFPWGATPVPGAANIAGARGRPMPVGSFPLGRTPSGIQDLIGNVWEWTSSAARPYPGGVAPPGGEQLRVIRGGAYDMPEANAHASFRGWMPPNADRSFLEKTGFRCVVELGPASRP